MQRSTNQFIAIGEKAFNHYLNNVPKERIICAPKYVEKYPEDTSNMRIQNFLEKNQQRKTILYSGRLMKIKGVEYLIKAFSELEKKFNNAMLLIIGEGELKTDLEMLSKELDVKNIEFWDWLKPEELNLLYKNCYVFVQPSIFIDYRYEVNGYSIYECMAYAKPIITTDAVGASPQFVKHGYNGFVVESANSEALMDVLVTLIESEDLAGIMGQRSKNIYDTEISLSGQIAAFRKAIQTI
jgi:glycosyltransferase involved in cell wall biosynthesis